MLSGGILPPAAAMISCRGHSRLAKPCPAAAHLLLTAHDAAAVNMYCTATVDKFSLT